MIKIRLWLFETTDDILSCGKKTAKYVVDVRPALAVDCRVRSRSEKPHRPIQKRDCRVVVAC